MVLLHIAHTLHTLRSVADGIKDVKEGIDNVASMSDSNRKVDSQPARPLLTIAATCLVFSLFGGCVTGAVFLKGKYEGDDYTVFIFCVMFSIMLGCSLPVFCIIVCFNLFAEEPPNQGSSVELKMENPIIQSSNADGHCHRQSSTDDDVVRSEVVMARGTALVGVDPTRMLEEALEI
jgi:hypothetical protein